MMVVEIYCINKGTSSQFFGLKDAKENAVIYGAPNNWKTKQGAKRWAIKNGLLVIE